MEATGKDRRDFVKLKVLFYLQSVQQREGRQALKSAGQIARGSASSYDSVRTLLRRWNQNDWIQRLKKEGVKQVRVRKGFGYLECVETPRLGSDAGANSRWGFRLVDKGERYLKRAEKWHPCWEMARDQIIRTNSLALLWHDRQATKIFYIRMPFIVYQKGTQLITEDFGRPDEEMSDSGKVKFFRDGMDAAFVYAAKLPTPPSSVFRQFVVRYVLKARQDEQARLQQNKPSPSTANQPNVQQTGIESPTRSQDGQSPLGS